QEAMLGKGLAEVLKADAGDSVVVVSQGADGSIANDIYRITGIVESGNQMSDRLAFYLPLQTAQQLLVLENRVHEIAVVVQHLKSVPAVTEKIRQALNNDELEVVPWQVFASSFYQAMQADKQGMWISLFIIVLIVAVGVLNTVLMSVLERRREYGLLKAVGTQPAGIFGLVLYEVSILALCSIFIGAILSLIVNYIFSRYGITLPQSFTYGGMEFTTMYTEINFRSFAIPAVTILFSAALISLFPALKAARTEPAKAMRMH
ncbi:MAG: FtsX-like permease family protein, partial [Calditrichia bacterium]